MNHFLFLEINRFHSPLIDAVMNAVSLTGNFWNILWLLLLLCFVYGHARRRGGHAGTRLRIQTMELATTLIIAFVISSLMVTCLKIGIHAPRPGTIFGTGVIHTYQIEDSPYSFPSGHSAFSMMVLCALWHYLRNRAIRVAMVCFVLWVGISRISLGMHFPLDVLAGYVIGAVSAWLARAILVRLKLTLSVRH